MVAPTLDLNGGGAGTGTTVNFTENGAALVLASAATVTDPDDTNIESATVTSTGGFQALNDFLSINGSASGTASAISFEYSSFTGVMTLTGTATLATYQAVLRLIKFQATSDDPGATRSISFTVNDGDSNSAAAIATVNITEVNDAPFGVDKTVGINEDATYVFATADFVPTY